MNTKMMMNVHIFIQARIGSTRLPGKVIKKISNKTIIELIIERALKIKGINEIFVVTGPQEKNLPLIHELEKLNVKYFCGNEDNVLDRFYNASNLLKSDIIIRITADSPLIDADIISKALEKFSQNKFDILSVNRIKTFPHGLNFEIFSKTALEKSWNEVKKQFLSKEQFDRTFIPPTKFMLENTQFKNYDLINDKNLENIRITLDYPEDFELIEKIYDSLYINGKYFGLDEIREFLAKNQELLKINKKYV